MPTLVAMFLFGFAGVCLAVPEPGSTELLVVEIGAKDGAAAATWCQDGRRLVQVLTTDAAVATKARTAWDKVGLTGRATIVQVPDFKHLPYATDLVDVAVVEDWSTVNPAEIARVVVPRGRVIVRHGGDNAGKELAATKEADGAWRLPADPTAGITDHAPSLRASGLQMVPDDVAVKYGPRRGPFDARLSSGWIQWLDGVHRNGLRETKDASAMLTGYGVHVVAGALAHSLFARGGDFFLSATSPGSLEVRDAFNGLLRWSRPFYFQGYTGSILALTPHWLLAAVPRGDAGNETTKKNKRDSLPAQDLVAWNLVDGQEVGRVPAPGSGKVLQILTEGDRAIVVRPEGATAYALKPTGPWNEIWSVSVSNVIAGSLDAGNLVLVSGALPRFVSVPEGIRSVACTSLTAFKSDGVRAWAINAEQLGGKKRVWLGQGHGLALMVIDNELVAWNAAAGVKAWTLPLAEKRRSEPRVGVVDDSLAISGDTILLVDPTTGAIRKKGEITVNEGYGNWACSAGNFSVGLIRRALGLTNAVAEPVGIGSAFVNPTCRISACMGEGMVFSSQHHCTCYVLAIHGAYAIRPVDANVVLAPGELERGPAFGVKPSPVPPGGQFRSDSARSCRGDAVTAAPRVLWRTRLPTVDLTSPLAQVSWRAEHRFPLTITPPVVAGELILVALPSRRQVVALRQKDGVEVWRFTADGLIDSPPTLAGDLTVFGCHDGRVYAVESNTGRLVWRRRISPVDEQIITYGQFESRFPVPGAVLVQDGVIRATAGVGSQQGIWYAELDAATGAVTAYRRLPESAAHRNIAMDRIGPSFSNDVLSTDPTGKPWCSILPLDPKVTGPSRGDQLRTADASILSIIRSSSPIGQANVSAWHAQNSSPEKAGWQAQVQVYHSSWKAKPSPIIQSQVGSLDGQHTARSDLMALGARGLYLAWDGETIYGVNCYGFPQKDDLNFDLTAMPGGALFAFPVAALTNAQQLPRTFKVTGGPFLQHAELVVPTWSRIVDPQPIWALSTAGHGLLVAGPVIEPATVPTPALRYWAEDPTPPTIRDPVLSPGWLRWLAPDGSEKAKLDLPSSPTQDGILSIGGKVWMTLQDGSVLCLGS